MQRSEFAPTTMAAASGWNQAGRGLSKEYPPMIWSPPVLWTVIGLALIALEALLPGLVILFFGIGALITALACLAFGLETSHQLVVFALSSLVSLATLRGTLKKIFQGRSQAAREQLSRMQSFVGVDGVVTEAIPLNGSGRIRVRGSFYTAVAGSPVAVGEAVRIVEDTRGDHSVFKVEKL
jgi:membrane protein implicated in regulation of membrane protease activity